MKNIFTIGIVVIAMGYMVSIMIGKYNTIIEEDKTKKALQQKQK